MPSPSPGPSADVSVRVAWADDAPALADLQVRAWPRAYEGLVPAEAFPTDPAPVAQAWRTSLARPADARNRVLVALDRDRLVGFAVTGPALDPDRDPVADGELLELVVDQPEQRRGHGSRLLQAVADTLRSDRFTRAVHWVASTDDARRGFLVGSGWGADGASRELDLDGSGATRVRQVRLHTDLAG